MQSASIALLIFRWFYRRRTPGALESTRPRLKWFPKYRTSVRLPEGIVSSAAPHEPLEKRLASSGFAFESSTREAIHFTRGKSWGDFSIKLIKLRVSFATPLSETTTMDVEVADVCLFDTGDLWDVTKGLVETIENPLAQQS